MHGLEILSLLSTCVAIGVVLFVVSLLNRLVKSNERIANAIEAAVAKLRGNDR